MVVKGIDFVTWDKTFNLTLPGCSSVKWDNRTWLRNDVSEVFVLSAKFKRF